MLTSHRPRPALRVLLTVAALSIAGAGVASAVWSTTATGSGSATGGDLTISGEAVSGETVTDTLYPGGSADAVIKIHNPNPYPVQVVAITATAVPQAGNGCTPTGVSFAAPADPQFSLGAGQSTVLHLPGAMSMDLASASTCQGQTFSLPVTVTVRK
ncbi:hypothetical protein [Actinophytocola sp.]|uniref:hypothetical protein n=1 Tax=Actinophytocola sp. TaxID=1872138 RepID=UPI002ED55684